MNPPSAVRITTALMFLSILLGIAVAFTQPLPATPTSATIPSSSLMMIVHVGIVVISLLEAVFVFFYYKGQNWARWLVMLDSLYQLILLIRVGKAWSISHISGSLVIANALLAIYLLYYLNSVEAKRYFMPKSPEYAQPVA
jgi:hypothetical protein